MIGTVLGLPGYAAIAIALGFTGLGVFIDLNRISGLGTVFKGCYFAGCVLSVCWVKRRALFGPMVQPPLLLALAVPGVVLLSGNTGGGGGMAARALAIGAPLLNGFPTMAVATAFALAIGIARYVLQRPPPPAPAGPPPGVRGGRPPSGPPPPLPPRGPRPPSARGPRPPEPPPGPRPEAQDRPPRRPPPADGPPIRGERPRPPSGRGDRPRGSGRPARDTGRADSGRADRPQRPPRTRDRGSPRGRGD
jgi:hypothetical protein